MIKSAIGFPEEEPPRIRFVSGSDKSTWGDPVPLVDSSPLGYKEGMITETRPAPHWRMPIADYTQHLRAKRRSEGTIKLRSYHLRVISQSFRSRDPYTLTPPDLERFLANLGDGRARNTQRSYLTSARNFYQWARKSGHMMTDPTEYIDSISPVIGTPRPASWDDITNAINKAEPRVRLMIQIATTAGLRAFEIAAINRNDLHRDRRGEYVLTVPRGKGEKPREIPLLPIIGSKIEDALEASPSNWLFPSTKYGSFGEPIKGKRVTELVSEALPLGVTCHMLRHTFASTHYAEEHDLLALRDALGHKSTATTEVYTRTPMDAIRRGVNAIGKYLV